MAYKRPAAVGWEMVGVLARGALFTSMPASFSSASIRAEAAPASFLPWPDARIRRIQREQSLEEKVGEDRTFTRKQLHCPHLIFHADIIRPDLPPRERLRFFPQHAQQAYAARTGPASPCAATKSVRFAALRILKCAKERLR